MERFSGLITQRVSVRGKKFVGAQSHIVNDSTGCDCHLKPHSNTCGRLLIQPLLPMIKIHTRRIIITTLLSPTNARIEPSYKREVSKPTGAFLAWIMAVETNSSIKESHLYGRLMNFSRRCHKKLYQMALVLERE